MKLTKKIVTMSLCAVTVAVSSYVAFDSLSSMAAPQYINEAQQQYPVANSHSTYDRLFGSVDELYENSDLVAEIKIKEQETVQDVSPSTVQTRSFAEVKQVLKGDVDLREIIITESGGLADMSNVKGNEMRSSGREKKQDKVEIVPDGSPVMKKGNTYLVFLIDTKDEYWGYTITGSIQGKVRIDDLSNQAVITADKRAYSNDPDLFFLQKKYAGKQKQEILDSIKKLK